MTSALVLNATYEPLGVISERRAVVLVMADTAFTVEAHDDRLYRSEHRSISAPSVVRLRRYVRRPHRDAAPYSRRGVLVRDKRTCVYCLGRADSVDHIHPRSRGGLDRVWTAVAASCRPCNVRKRDRTPEEANMPLRFQPYEPSPQEAFVFNLAHVDNAWVKYLTPERERKGFPRAKD